MKHTVHFLILLSLLLLSCSSNNSETHLKSRNGHYTIEIQIGDRVKKEEKYNVVFRLVDENGSELDYLNTRASDIMKWAATWANDSTVVLDSRDIGTCAWRIKDGKFQKIEVTNEMLIQVDLAFQQKYSVK